MPKSYLVCLLLVFSWVSYGGVDSRLLNGWLYYAATGLSQLPPLAVNHGQRCGTGTVELSVSGCADVQWYAQSTGGIALGAGNSFTTPVISSTTVYWVACGNEIVRTPVYAVVHPAPVDPILTADTDPICPGTATFTAQLPDYASAHKYRYEFLKNGLSLGAPTTNNTITLSNLQAGDHIQVRTHKMLRYDGKSDTLPDASQDTRFWPAQNPAWTNDLIPSFGNNNRINGLLITGIGDSIFMLLSGRVMNFNRIILFIDSKPGGYNVTNFGRFDTPPLYSLKNLNSNITFDADFNADYALTFGTFTGEVEYYADLYTLSGTFSNPLSGGPKNYLGSNTMPVPFRVTPASNSMQDLNNGFELGLAKSAIGYTGGDLKIFAMLTSDFDNNQNTVLSNHFLTPAVFPQGNYGNGAINFNNEPPNPMVIPDKLLQDVCIGESNILTVLPAPDVNILPAAPLVCATNPTPTTLQVVELPGATYLWSSGGTTSTFQTALTGTYTVTVTGSNGCTNSQLVTVDIQPAPTVVLTPTHPTGSNADGAISTAVLPVNTYSYTWSNGATTAQLSNLSSGTYTVTVSDGICATTQSVTLVANNTAPIITCAPVTVILDSLSGTYTLTGSEILQSYTDDNSAEPSLLTVSPQVFNCSHVASGVSGDGGLFFSEYIEAGYGTGNSKLCFLEIFNNSSADIDLSHYSIRIYENDSPIPTQTYNLSGTLATAQAQVYKRAGTVGPGVDLANLFFDGNDGVALWHNGLNRPVDIIGTLGNHPLDGWTAAGGQPYGPGYVRTFNTCLRRKPHVQTGMHQPQGQTFGTLVQQWEQVMPPNTTTGLGGHTVAPSATAQSVILTATDNNGSTASCITSVYVTEAVAPQMQCVPTFAAYYKDDGAVSITPQDLLVGTATDNCGLSSTHVFDAIFECTNDYTTPATGIFISEYYEGFSGNNKYLEIFNGTGAAYTFGPNDFIKSYPIGVAGNFLNNSYSLTGTIPANGKRLFKPNLGTVDYPQGTAIPNVLSINGNDVIELVINNEVVDRIGVLNSDPDPQSPLQPFYGWFAPTGHRTANAVIRRKPYIKSGFANDQNSWPEPNLSNQWYWFDIQPEQNLFDDFLEHDFNTPRARTTLQVYVTDNAGNPSNCFVQVTVTDTIKPTIVCPPQVVVNAGTGCSATVQPQAPQVADNCTLGAQPYFPLISTLPTTYTTGTHNVVFTATDISNNTQTCQWTIQVVDNTPPVINCSPLTASIGDNGTYMLNAASMATASDNCSTPVISPATQSFDCTQIGTQTVVFTATDAAGLTASCSALLTLTGQGASTTITASQTVVNCSNPTTSLTASGSGSFTWSTNATTQTITVSPTATTTYTVTFTAANGCSATAGITVNANFTPPTVTVSPALLILDCNDPAATITATTNGSTLLWSNGSTSSGITVSPTQSTTYTVTATGSNGCTAVASAEVVVDLAPPTATATAAPGTITPGQSSTLSAGGGTSYVWSNGNQSATQVVSPVATTTYTVTVTDAEGCTATALVTVTVLTEQNPCDYPNIFIPNSFSPNADGNNERFRVRGSDLTFVLMRVYNRWGQEVFSERISGSAGVAQVGWDGRFNGELVAPDVYGWYVEIECVNGDRYFERGNVTVFR